MNTFFVSGRTGAGKSRLLEMLIETSDLMLVDPLASPPYPWVEPDHARYRGVVVDHAYKLATPKETIEEIVAWCKQHDLPLWGGEQRIEALLVAGIVLPKDFVELNLLFPGECSRIEQNAKCRSIILDDAIELAQLAMTLCGKQQGLRLC
ncbi:hypothetical protein [Duganella vulcania]|uniref:Uncharacterized protein n=1 Tax=Duganella vulcania TaxID=2692166 RepID=A0A845GDR9_9BURK|nr:hypothetical protein [Duganella vulcania]MYM92424.1 hypothetical protein [Duganella vulcania]